MPTTQSRPCKPTNNIRSLRRDLRIPFQRLTRSAKLNQSRQGIDFRITIVGPTGEWKRDPLGIALALPTLPACQPFGAAAPTAFRRRRAIGGRLMLDFRIEFGAEQTTMVDIHIQIINAIAAPSEPYVAS